MIGSQFPSRPNAGDAITARWAQKVCDSLRAVTPIAGNGIRLSHTTNGTIITADGTVGRASGSSATADNQPHPFKVEAVSKSPAAVSGEADDIFVYAGRINGLLAVINGNTPLEGGSIQLPTTGMMTSGAYWYVYAEARNGGKRPVIKCAQYTPLDAAGVRYITLAAVRAKQSGSIFNWEVLQYVDSDFECDFPHGFECSFAIENGVRYLDMNGGAAIIACQNWGHPELFSDASHRLGAKRYDYPSFQSLVIPSTGSGTLSLWVAFEYPKKGTALASNLWGKLTLTPTAQMPLNRPWVIVAESNPNANSAQNDLGPGAPTNDSPQTAEDLESQQAEAATAPTLAGAIAALEAEAPLPHEFDTVDTVTTTPADTSGTYYGPYGRADWTRTNRTLTYTWKKAGVTVKTASRTYAQTFAITASYLNTPSSGQNQNNYLYGLVGPGAYTGLSTNPVQTYGALWNKSWSYSNSGVLDITTNLTLPSGLLIDGGVQVGYIKWEYLTSDSYRGYATDVSGYREATIGRVSGTDLFYGSSSASDGRAPSDADPANNSDGSSTDAASDYPGRPPRGVGIASPPSATETNQGASSGGTAVTAAGPGLWVYEIARINAQTGELVQINVGEILIHPAPQVCLRTNPKVAALP